MPALNYYSSDGQTILGHYSVTQKSGTMAASLTAASPVASFRWAPTNNSVYAVLLRVKVQHSVLSTIGATTLDFSGTIARNFTVDYSSGNTQANMASWPATGANRTNVMVSSQLGTKGPQIATTAAMSGATATFDNDFSHAVAMNNGTTVVGYSDSKILYERNMEGQHPIEFSGSAPAGYIVRNIAVGPTGTFALYVTWEWAEVLISMV